MMTIGKYSFGIGDRFAHEGVNQLKALLKVEQEYGVHFVPVWNKSNREHTIVGTVPMETREEADAAVAALGYKDQYFVDADHINLNNVDKFIDACDFFTIDVADYIGKEGSLEERFLPAIKEAGKIYRHICEKKGEGNFVTEVSMDEVDVAQTPEELRYILREIAREGIPAQTIAPKFTGRFNKGVDYQGDLAQFEKEFEEDLQVINECIKEYGLPENLKLSIHSGSDKFSIYPIMGKLLKKYDRGIHIKTAGTTWLEEIIGLSVADADALALAKKIYRQALGRMDELTVPYATVIDVHVDELPDPDEVDKWDADKFARALRHNESDPLYNPSMRQLLHVSFKIAAELKDEYIPALEKHADVIGKQIADNLGERHVKILFNK
ncbi:MAG: tagaturonate epimerase family protein [Bacteroidales bacterium]|nr:tagaturonate epimerase family protein [Bacteroidales bacterium]